MNVAVLLAMLTEAVVLVVTVALAIYLLSITLALRDATKYLYQLTDGLTRMERETESLNKTMTAVQAGHAQLLSTLRAADESLAQMGKPFVGEERPRLEPVRARQNGHNGGAP